MESIPTNIKNKLLVKKRREQLVLAAIKLFAKKGYHKTTLKNIAEASGLSYGNIYDYVGSKGDILFLIHEYIVKMANAKLQRALEGVENPLEKIRRMIHAELEFMFEWNDAVLLIYRETHILVDNRELLRKVLERERARHSIIESLIKECIESGYFRKISVRVISNLVKILCEACVLKRWDLKDHTTRAEMENHILSLLFHGLEKEKIDNLDMQSEEERPFNGMKALIINGGTRLSTAIAMFLSSKGMRLAIYANNDVSKNNKSSLGFSLDDLITDDVKWYSAKKYGNMSWELLQQIEDEFGECDYLIHDIGNETECKQKEGSSLGEELKSNLRCAQNLASHLKAEKPKSKPKGIIYLAPCAWDEGTDPLSYGLVSAGSRSLTKELAKQLSALNVNVNCVVPGYVVDMEPLGKRSKNNAEIENERSSETRSTRIGDLLNLISFLVSDGSGELTGQILETGTFEN